MNRRKVCLALVILGLSGAGGALPADAANKRPAMKAKAPTAHEDCVPLNGKYGYYGNPWCDTGSYRLEDIWFRERQAAARAKWRAAR